MCFFFFSMQLFSVGAQCCFTIMSGSSKPESSALVVEPSNRGTDLKVYFHMIIKSPKISIQKT